VLLHALAVGCLLFVAADLLPKLGDHTVLRFVLLPQALFLVSLCTLKSKGLREKLGEASPQL